MKKLRLHPGTLEACLAQKANYEAIFHSMSDGLFIINNEYFITQCNEPFVKITGTITGGKDPTGNKVYIAMIESVFGGELKKWSLRVSDSVEVPEDERYPALPRMKDLVLVKIEEEIVVGRYKGEKVNIPLGSGFGVSPTKQGP